MEKTLKKCQGRGTHSTSYKLQESGVIVLKTTENAQRKVSEKIQKIFEGVDNAPLPHLKDEILPPFLNKMPRNFKTLFAFAQFKCHCHQLHLTMPNILRHAAVDSEEWLAQVLQPEKINGKRNCAYWRRQNERSVRRFVNVAQALTDQTNFKSHKNA